MEEFNYHRISVYSYSYFRFWAVLGLLILYCYSILNWPAYLADGIKGIFCFSATLIAYFYLKRQKKHKTYVLHIHESGKISTIMDGVKKEAKLTQSSYVLPWALQLNLSSELNNSKTWLTLYNDQLDDVSVRRIRRLILKMKQQN